jgi:hypothetical protein
VLAEEARTPISRTIMLRIAGDAELLAQAEEDHGRLSVIRVSWDPPPQRQRAPRTRLRPAAFNLFVNLSAEVQEQALNDLKVLQGAPRFAGVAAIAVQFGD